MFMKLLPSNGSPGFTIPPFRCHVTVNTKQTNTIYIILHTAILEKVKKQRGLGPFNNPVGELFLKPIQPAIRTEIRDL
jgi:hypothetical protein